MERYFLKYKKFFRFSISWNIRNFRFLKYQEVLGVLLFPKYNKRFLLRKFKKFFRDFRFLKHNNSFLLRKYKKLFRSFRFLKLTAAESFLILELESPFSWGIRNFLGVDFFLFFELGLKSTLFSSIIYYFCATLLKRYFKTDVFLWNLQKFWKHLFLQNTSGGCSWELVFMATQNFLREVVYRIGRDHTWRRLFWWSYSIRTAGVLGYNQWQNIFDKITLPNHLLKHLGPLIVVERELCILWVSGFVKTTNIDFSMTILNSLAQAF